MSKIEGGPYLPLEEIRRIVRDHRNSNAPAISEYPNCKYDFVSHLPGYSHKSPHMNMNVFIPFIGDIVLAITLSQPNGSWKETCFDENGQLIVNDSKGKDPWGDEHISAWHKAYSAIFSR